MSNFIKENAVVEQGEDIRILARRAVGVDSKEPLVEVSAIGGGGMRGRIGGRGVGGRGGARRGGERRGGRAGRGPNTAQNAERNAARIARRNAYLENSIVADGIFVGGSAAFLGILGAGGAIAETYAVTHTAVATAIGWTFLGTELVMSAVTLGALFAATKLVPVLAPVTNWLVKKVWKHTFGRILHAAMPGPMEKFDAWVGKQSDKLQNLVYQVLDLIPGKPGTNILKPINDYVTSWTDWLDGKHLKTNTESHPVEAETKTA